MWDYLGYTYNSVIIFLDGFFGTFWPWLLLLACFVAFFYAQPAKTKQLLAGLMLAAEKKAVEMALETGQAKMDYVVDQAYNILPPITRLFISKEMLRVIAQKVFDEAKTKIESTLDPNTPEHDDITPIEPEEPPEKL